MTTAHFAINRLKLLGTGRSLPGPPVSNDILCEALESVCHPRAGRRARSIAYRLGITHRHLSRDLHVPLSGTRTTMQAPQLCHAALSGAMLEAGIGIGSVEYLIGHTSSPHTLLPPNIAWVADELQYTGPYLELRQACTGFANGLQIASAMAAANRLQAIAIVGSETGSPYCDISDGFLSNEQLVNYVQMGDGAGAVIVGQDDGSEDQILSNMFVGQIGLGREPGFFIEGGGSSQPQCRMQVPVFRHHVQTVREHGGELFVRGVEAMMQRGHALREFDWILPHQANGRLAHLFSQYFGVPEEKIYVTADKLGNLGSAAIWVSLDMLRRSGDLHKGQRVLILGAEASKFLYGGFVYTH
ncbi:MAG: 3-oxoacyl-ACP synthase III family protein [Nitrospiraceae bacterium]